MRALGVQLFGVCPQLQEHNVSLHTELDLSFHLLHDAGNQVAEDYGLAVDTPDEVREVESSLGLNLPLHNGTQDWRLPMPSTVVIGANGLVHSAIAQVDHALRPEPSDTVALLRELS